MLGEIHGTELPVSFAALGQITPPEPSPPLLYCGKPRAHGMRSHVVTKAVHHRDEN